MKLLYLALILGGMFPTIADARQIVADLAVRNIQIAHDFTGMDILLYGARNDTGSIVVVVRGPEQNFVVRKKERMNGIWVNNKSVRLNGIPAFYHIASTKDLDTVKNDALLNSLKLGLNSLTPLVTDSEKTNVEEFMAAFIEERKKESLYSYEADAVSFWEETLFRSLLNFPKNVDKGLYTVEVYLFSDGRLSALQSMPLEIKKIGFEAFVYDTAYHYSFIYGIVCVLMAVMAGYGANIFFRKY